MRNAVHPLFATPIMVSGGTFAFAPEEQAFLDGLEFVRNVGNAMSRDDRVLDAPALARLRAFVDEHVSVYVHRLWRIREDLEVHVTQSWVNRAGPGQFHARHRHPNSIVSGVLFLDDDPDEALPPIAFHRPQEPFPLQLDYRDLDELNASARTFPVERGRLILFPSLLEHDVGPNETDRTRSTLSFNTFVRGVAGRADALTEVRLR